MWQSNKQMQAWTDADLLNEYVGRKSEAAFGEIVRRYANLVYSAALRQTGGAEEARDVAQMVFTDLARKDGSISASVALAGWLYRGVRLQSLELRRNDQRRQWRERQAMNSIDRPSEPDRDWSALRPVLDDAMSNLDGEDRDALLLRFFNNQSLAAVGAALGVSEDAAQKRVARALGKLREFLAHRGIDTSAAALALTLMGNASETAPGAFAASWASSALAGAPRATPAFFHIVNMKTALAIFALAGALAVVSVSHVRLLRQRNQLQSALQSQSQQLAALQAEIAQLKARPTGPSDWDTLRELARARAKIQRLQSDLDSEKSHANRLEATAQPTNNRPSVPQISIDCSFIRVPMSEFPPLNGTLNAAQAQLLKSGLLTNQHGELLSAPRVVTLSGRAAKVTTGESVPFADGTTNVGFSVDLLPQFSASSGPIDLTVGVQVSGLTPAGEFKSLNTNATFSIPGDATATMTILAPDNWGDANPFSGTTNALVVFITPTFIDAAGNRLPAPATNAKPVNANPTGVFPSAAAASAEKPEDQ